jgi:hypothetical protein
MVLYADDDDNEIMRIPMRNEVCWRCEGDGGHDAWSGGMTAEEMYEQGDEFIEDYRAGRYDVTCTECNGRCVLPVADLDRCTPEQREAYEQHMNVMAEWRAERAAEIAAGC